ncbi:MAG: S9 family peptidase [Alteromonadaceae bacterium]|nr:S9 family peptidase [Alteromonadaceae bacterium]
MPVNTNKTSRQNPPIAKKMAHEMIHHDHSRVDHYYWMRDDSRSDKEMLAHLEAENNYADAMLTQQKPLQDSLFNELKGRIVKDDNSIPTKDGKYWYHSEISGEEEYCRYYRADSYLAESLLTEKLSAADNSDTTANEQSENKSEINTENNSENKTLLLDVNERAKNTEFYDLGDISISPNDQFMTLSEDTDGRRIYDILFKDLDSKDTNNYLPDVLLQTEGQIVWASDNKMVFYVKKDPETLLGTEVYRHKLGTDQADDVLVYQEDDHSFYMSLSKSRDESIIFIDLHATESTNTFQLNADDPDGEFTQLVEHQEQHEYSADKLGDWFYIVTNWQAKNFRLMKVAVDKVSDKNNWQEIIAHRNDVLLEDVELFNGFIVLSEREQGQIRFIVHKISDNKLADQYPLEFDDPCYFACLGNNPEPESTSVRVYYSSMTTPSTHYDFDLATGERKLLKQQQVLGNFNPDNYRSERISVTARDGVSVPASIVYRHDIFKKDGTNPLLQEGYGAYGIIFDPSFSSEMLSLLDRGFVYVIAHIRGSEMLGRHWYDHGKKEHKQNTFNDFIDVTKALVAQGYGASDKIFASGGSAGGLLMGAVINQAPELYLGIGCHVPFLDVLTTMLDESIPLTTNEYDEWGNPNEADHYQTILNYSPYDNISAQHYPNILVTTGLHDSQVQYFEPMKWVAKMREIKTDNNLLLFKTDMDVGHGGASGRFKSLKEKALEMAFFINLLE